MCGVGISSHMECGVPGEISCDRGARGVRLRGGTNHLQRALLLQPHFPGSLPIFFQYPHILATQVS